MGSNKVSGDIGPIIDIALIAALGFAAWKVYGLFGGGGPSPPPNVPSPLGTGASVTPQVAKGETAMNWLATFEATPGVSNPFNQDLYMSNPDASTMDLDTLTSVAAAIHDTGPNWLTRITNMSNGEDWQIVYSLFQRYFTKQIDVSNVAIVFEQNYGEDLLSWLDENGNLGNLKMVGDRTNIEGLQKIIQYVLSLPVQ